MTTSDSVRPLTAAIERVETFVNAIESERDESIEPVRMDDLRLLLDEARAGSLDAATLAKALHETGTGCEWRDEHGHNTDPGKPWVDARHTGDHDDDAEAIIAALREAKQ